MLFSRVKKCCSTAYCKCFSNTQLNFWQAFLFFLQIVEFFVWNIGVPVFPPSANWLFPLYCSIPAQPSWISCEVWRVSRVFSSLSKHFSAAHLSQFVGLVEATCSVYTYCCTRACCTYYLNTVHCVQGLSLKLQVRAEPHLNLACSACYFYLKNIPVWHCSLFAHVLSRVKCLLLWKYFVSVQKYLYIFCLFWIFLSTFVVPWKYIFFFLFSILRTTFEAIYF